MIREGSRWRIGNGESVCIWKDSWLGYSPPFRVISPKNDFDEDLKVSALINHEEGSWRMDIMRYFS